MDSIWDNKEGLEKLESIRDSLRANGKRLSFDCFNLKCQGDRAVCSEGKMNSSRLLVSILRGRTYDACRGCQVFDTE